MRKFLLRLVLPAILMLSAILRLIGTYPGFHPNHSDESFIYSNAIEMIRQGTIEPFRYEYPALTPIINIVFFNLFFFPVMWIKFFVLHLGEFIDGFLRFPLPVEDYKRFLQIEIVGNRDVHVLIWSRIVTAFFGVGVVYLTFFVTKKLFNKNIAYIASLLVAVNYRQVLNSHLTLPDIYNGFFLLLGFFIILYIWERKNISYYIYAGIVFGCVIATKYQPFVFIPFLVAHYNSFKSLLTPKWLLTPAIAALLFIIMNPYLFLNIERAIADISYASVKYASGRNILDFYSYSYLFKLGIGPVTSLFVIFGIVYGYLKERRKTVLLLSLIVPFFYFWTIYSSGGFYTRNFVSITPFLLIFAAYATYQCTKFSNLYKVAISLLFVVMIWENLSKSLIIIKEYTQPWNTSIIADYVKNNIPDRAKISAHSSVPLMDTQIRLPYEIDQDYNLDEFSQSGAEYAITNLDWTSVDFYWWMRQSTFKSLEYWNKPVHLMKDTYRALSVAELQQFSTFSIINSSLAPDSDFFVTKLPSYTVTNKSFVKDILNWEKSHPESEVLIQSDEVLEIRKSTPEDITQRWISEQIDITGWDGFVIDFEMKNEIGIKPEGFVYVKFYNNQHQEVGIRMSSRNDISSKWVKKSLIGEIPSNATTMRIYFQAYNYNEANISLQNVVVYNARVTAEFEDIPVTKLDVDESNLYPNSHGNM